MNLLRDEENANYRSVIKNTLEFDPEVLKRYVNFMSNPDERTAVEQFGKGDKYFGVCTLMATLPGLPMFGHGQIEGLAEKYGMEFRRPRMDERPDEWLLARHEREITPLLQRRALFAEAREFLLYDFFTDDGHVNEDVFVHSNRLGSERGLVVVHNRYARTAGWVRMSCAYAARGPDGATQLRRRTLGEAFDLPSAPGRLVAFRDARTGLEHLHHAHLLIERGLRIELEAYQSLVFLDWREVVPEAGREWFALCDRLAGQGVPSLDAALSSLERQPVHDTVQRLLDPAWVEGWSETSDEPADRSDADPVPATVLRIVAVRDQIARFAASAAGRAAGLDPLPEDPSFADRVSARLTTLRDLPRRMRASLRMLPAAAGEVLPVGDDRTAPPAWGAALVTIALEELGRPAVPRDPDAGAVRLFDRLALREAVAHALERLGAQDEEPWRSAARIRATFAHPALAPGPGSELTPAWLDDSDTAWAAGAHESGGVRYLVRESYERLLWWLALRPLLDAAATDQTPARIAAAIADRLGAAERASWRVEAIGIQVPAGHPRA
jgi:hypothetical protein